MPPRRVFADTFYWLALLNPRDAFHARATALGRTLASVGFVTTDEVLTEVLDAVCGAGYENDLAFQHAHGISSLFFCPKD